MPYSRARLIRQRGPVAICEARDPKGSKAALRCLDRSLADGDPVGIARFRREVAIATSMYHPGLATCLGAGEDWIAFEWLESGLDTPEQQARFREPTALRGLLEALAGTLAYLHARGVVHADIKPEHVRFRGSAPVLVDFGIAAVGTRDPLYEGEQAGSPRWMAPELVLGGVPSPASDVWSLCAVVAWLWNGAPGPTADGPAILVERATDPDAHLPSLAGLEERDARLHEIVTLGLGRPASRPTAARIVQLISSSTAG